MFRKKFHWWKCRFRCEAQIPTERVMGKLVQCPEVLRRKRCLTYKMYKGHVWQLDSKKATFGLWNVGVYLEQNFQFCDNWFFVNLDHSNIFWVTFHRVLQVIGYIKCNHVDFFKRKKNYMQFLVFRFNFWSWMHW